VRETKGVGGDSWPKRSKEAQHRLAPLDVQRIQTVLEDRGFLDGVDDLGRLTFRTIWGRVKRLEELLGVIEGTTDPRYRAGLSLHERAAKLIQDVGRRTHRINQLLDKDGPVLDAIAKYAEGYREQAAREFDFAQLFEVEDEIIQEARAIDLESNWNSFGELCQSLLSLNTKIRDYNQDKVAALKNEVLKWSVQTVPKNLQDAKEELLSKRLS
jgi:hypothetical protein